MRLNIQLNRFKKINKRYKEYIRVKNIKLNRYIFKSINK